MRVCITFVCVSAFVIDFCLTRRFSPQLALEGTKCKMLPQLKLMDDEFLTYGGKAFRMQRALCA